MHRSEKFAFHGGAHSGQAVVLTRAIISFFFTVMRLRNFGCRPLAPIGLLRIHDLGAALQFRVSWLVAARRRMRDLRHRLLRMLRRVVSIEMHANHGIIVFFILILLSRLQPIIPSFPRSTSAWSYSCSWASSCWAPWPSSSGNIWPRVWRTSCCSASRSTTIWPGNLELFPLYGTTYTRR